MDPVFLAAAFILGFAVRQVGLPPMVGFLAAGFVLGAFDIRGGALLRQLADLGVMLLLFSIGLKLNISNRLAMARRDMIRWPPSCVSNREFGERFSSCNDSRSCPGV